jgi:excinuclease ABC subunit A
MDVVRNSDWVVDLGPEGGTRGGRLMGEGPPETIAATEGSHTARFLREAMDRAANAPGALPDDAPASGAPPTPSRRRGRAARPAARKTPRETAAARRRLVRGG